MRSLNSGTRLQQIGRLSVVTPPAGAVIDLGGTGGLKHHLRVHHADDDEFIAAALAASVAQIDGPHGWLARSLLTRTLRLTLDRFPPRVVKLSGPPVTAINSVTYRDDSDTFITIDAADYQSDLTDSGRAALLWPVADKSWPAGITCGPDVFRVEYVAGYASGAAIPDLVKSYLKLRVGDLYRDRETTMLAISAAELPHAIHMLDNLRARD